MDHPNHPTEFLTTPIPGMYLQVSYFTFPTLLPGGVS
jgi:hypothetical protein